jgi:hypothetical protein
MSVSLVVRSVLPVVVLAGVSLDRFRHFDGNQSSGGDTIDSVILPGLPALAHFETRILGHQALTHLLCLIGTGNGRGSC